MYVLAVVALAASVSGGGNNVTASFQEFNTIESCNNAKTMFVEMKFKNNINVNAACLPK